MRFIQPIVHFIFLLLLCSCAGHRGEGTPPTALPEQKQPVEISPRETFGISEEDLQYIDLIIPEYAEIIFYYEDAPATLAFSEKLLAYFRQNRASIELHKMKKITDRENTGARRFYIDFTGDHRYVVRLYNDKDL